MSLRIVFPFVIACVGASLVVTACSYDLPLEVKPVGNAGAAGSVGVGGSTGSVGSGGASVSSSASSSTSGSVTSSSGAMPPAWWNEAWTHRIKITFKNDGGEVLNNFPVLVRLDDMRAPGIFASPKGDDLRFVDANGSSILAHEIDGWNKNGNSYIWVNVPRIEMGKNDYIWLYYGNPVVQDAQNVPGVWPDFTTVYHLSPRGAPVQFPDSRGVNHGKWGINQMGQVVQGKIVPGLINDAIDPDGMSAIDINENSIVAIDVGRARTIEAWVKPKLNQQNHNIVWQEGQCVGWTLATETTGEYMGTFITDTVLPLCSSGVVEKRAYAKETVGEWQYLTLVINRPTGVMDLYVDGNWQGTSDVENMGAADGNGEFWIGSNYKIDSTTFIGSIDEVRVSEGARSPGWIAAQHQSMTDGFIDCTVE